MRFLALLVAVATVALATAVPADDMPVPSKTLTLPVPKPTDVPTPGMSKKCHPCLVKNIRKVKACRWWKEKTPWLKGKPDDWNASQRACVCALSKADKWLEDCKKPKWCPDNYIGKVKLMYAKWQLKACGPGGKQ